MWQLPDFTMDGELKSPASLKRRVEIATQFILLFKNYINGGFL
jgi:hypothetical protein